MDGNVKYAVMLADGLDSRLTTSATSQTSNALSNKVASILSASFADNEIRDALHIIDEKKIQNTPEVRRRLRLDVQKEVIECNSAILKDFGHVAEVC